MEKRPAVRSSEYLMSGMWTSTAPSSSLSTSTESYPPVLYTSGRRRPPSMAYGSDARTCGTWTVGDTRFTLWQPARCSPSITSANCAGSISCPDLICDISQFWQYTHARLQEGKKIVLEPPG